MFKLLVLHYHTQIPRNFNMDRLHSKFPLFNYRISIFHKSTSQFSVEIIMLQSSRPPLPSPESPWRHQTPDNGHNLITMWREYKVCNGPYWKLSLSSHQYEINIVLEMKALKDLRKGIWCHNAYFHRPKQTNKSHFIILTEWKGAGSWMYIL